MKLKKTLAGAALALSTAILPQASKANPENSTNTASRVSVTEKAKKTSLPSWVAVDKDGHFDQDKAKEQATFLWKKHGKEIQKLAADIKAGMPEEVAFAQYAHRLAAGDKEKEKQILSHLDALNEVQKQQKIDTEKLKAPIVTGGVILALYLMWLAKGGEETCTILGNGAKTKALAGTIVTSAVGFPTETGLKHFDKFDDVRAKEALVQVQRAAYDFHQQRKKDYTTVDMKTAKKIGEMKQTKR